MIYWCKNCEIPYKLVNDHICPLCGAEGILVANKNLAPVFLQEKKILSHILDKDMTNENIWYKGRGYYLVSGKNLRVPFVEYFQMERYEEIVENIGRNIDLDDKIYNEDKLLQANEFHINSLIYEAEEYIISTIKKFEETYTPIVSFSGGKDSTVVSRLVRDAVQKNDIIHIMADTTLELPETYNYCDKIFRKENIYTPLIDSKPESDFFNLCNYLGPPSRFETWCCTIFKTSNMNYLVQFMPKGNGFLTFMGIRRSESNSRSKYSRTKMESKISKQIVAMPIIDWTDFDVWLYIRYKGLSFNDAYKMGYKRVGCWCCPHNSKWSDLLNAIYYPDLHLRWQKILYDFAEKTGKEDIDDYVKNDKWKTRKGASGLKARNVDIEDTKCYLNKSARNIIVDRSLNEEFIELIKPFGKLNVQIIGEEVLIDVVEDGEKVFSLSFIKGGSILKVLFEQKVDKNLLITRLKCQIRKYQFCIHCSACDSVCPKGAILTLHGKYKIDDEKCIHCKTCISYFYNGCLTSEVLAEKKSKEG